MVKKAVESKEWIDFASSLGSTPRYLAPAAFAKFVAGVDKETREIMAGRRSPEINMAVRALPFRFPEREHVLLSKFRLLSEMNASGIGLMTPRKEIASSLVLILFSLTFLIYTTRYPLDDWENPGPAVFPLILGGVLLLLAAWQLIRAFLAPKAPGRVRGKGSTINSREGIPSSTTRGRRKSSS